MLFHHLKTFLKKDVFLCNEIDLIITPNKINNDIDLLKKPCYFFGRVSFWVSTIVFSWYHLNNLSPAVSIHWKLDPNSWLNTWQAYFNKGWNVLQRALHQVTHKVWLSTINDVKFDHLIKVVIADCLRCKDMFSPFHMLSVEWYFSITWISFSPSTFHLMDLAAITVLCLNQFISTGIGK